MEKIGITYLDAENKKGITRTSRDSLIRIILIFNENYFTSNIFFTELKSLFPSNDLD